MAKVNIKTILHNITENELFNNEIIGIKEEKKIKYLDNEVLVTLEFIDEKIKLKRIGKDYNIYMLFDLNDKTEGVYKIDNLGEISLNVLTKKLIIEDNFIEIEYQMIIGEKEKQEFNYKIEYKEM